MRLLACAWCVRFQGGGGLRVFAGHPLPDGLMPFLAAIVQLAPNVTQGPEVFVCGGKSLLPPPSPPPRLASLLLHLSSLGGGGGGAAVWPSASDLLPPTSAYTCPSTLRLRASVGADRTGVSVLCL